MRPDTFMLPLRSGVSVRCWLRDKTGILNELELFEDVMLVKDNRDEDVFRYVPRGSDEYLARKAGNPPRVV